MDVTLDPRPSSSGQLCPGTPACRHWCLVVGVPTVVQTQELLQVPYSTVL